VAESQRTILGPKDEPISALIIGEGGTVGAHRLNGYVWNRLFAVGVIYRAFDYKPLTRLDRRGVGQNDQ
jgi:hypothetical protein